MDKIPEPNLSTQIMEQYLGERGYNLGNAPKRLRTAASTYASCVLARIEATARLSSDLDASPYSCGFSGN